MGAWVKEAHPNDQVEMYGLLWSPVYDPVQREMFVIAKGGRWEKKKGGYAGEGLFYHYKKLQQLLWPEDAHHRWSDLILEEILRNRITAILGSKDSGKTHCALSKFGLTDYFCFPQETLILISSTDMRGLELRVWGDLKNMFQRAKDRFPWLAGHLIDSKHCIATQNLKEDETRDLRRGLVCIPCLSSAGGWVGLGKFIGVKQKRRRLLSDECQVMKPAFLDAVANLNSGDFKGIFVGNPLGEGDPLDKVSEPKGGWGTEGEITKTTTWENRFLDGRTINLVGTDSPNFDQSQEPEPKYPFLINQKSIDNVVSFYGKDSLQYYSQCLGIRRPGLNARRVITKQLCLKFKAFDAPVWKDAKRMRIYAIDAAYGSVGGDRCVGGWGEIGEDTRGMKILALNEPVIIPVSAASQTQSPEDQIAEFAKAQCEENEIPAENVFYDATGRGSLGTAFARIWSAYVNPVEFGGKPTTRPVSADLLIYDEAERRTRPKRCDEQYSKFVTELWFTVRYLIESGQMRGMHESVAEEGYLREWKIVRGDKIEIESKADTKERMGRSPDIFDWCVTVCEGARRKGFVISKLAGRNANNKRDDTWKRDLRDRAAKNRESWTLEVA